jgi:hypothetical protein
LDYSQTNTDMAKKAKPSIPSLTNDMIDLWTDLIALWLKDPASAEWMQQFSPHSQKAQHKDSPHARTKKTQSPKTKSSPGKSGSRSAMAASKHGDDGLSKLADYVAAFIGGENPDANPIARTRGQNNSRRRKFKQG